MDDRSGLPRHHTLPHGSSTHTHPSTASSQSSQQMVPTPVMPVVPQPTPTALVSPTQLAHHPPLSSPSGPSPTNTYTGQVFSALWVFRISLGLQRYSSFTLQRQRQFVYVVTADAIMVATPIHDGNGRGNKIVLLREHKRHTARRVASTCCAALSPRVGDVVPPSSPIEVGCPHLRRGTTSSRSMGGGRWTSIGLDG